MLNTTNPEVKGSIPKKTWETAAHDIAVLAGDESDSEHKQIWLDSSLLASEKKKPIIGWRSKQNQKF